MEDNVAIRLKGFMDKMELSNSQFADTCGIPRPTLSQLLTGRNKKISDVLVGQIHSAYPRLSVLWLLFGEGDMLTPDPSTEQNPSRDGGLFDEEFTNATNDTDKLKYSNLKGLNVDKNASQSSVNNQHNLDLKNAELQREIDKMRKNPRKVTQIMVYYDDSTFETFYPGK